MNQFLIGITEAAHACLFRSCLLSINRLRRRKGYFPCGKLAIDAATYTELINHGRHRLSVPEYADLINYWKGSAEEILWVACQDYIVSDVVRKHTGLTVAESQRQTIANYDALIQLTDCPVLPVLHGRTPAEYLEHLEMWGDRLRPGAWCGVGSLKALIAEEIEDVLLAIKQRFPQLRLHGFGITYESLQFPLIADLLYSADSSAWSYSIWRKRENHNDPRHAFVYLRKVNRLIRKPIMESDDLIHYLINRNHRQRCDDLLQAIDLVQDLKRKQAEPTPEQRDTLLKFPGFGACARLFDMNASNSPAWEDAARQQLKELLGDDYRAARNTVLTQYFTDPRIIASIWRLQQQLGFNGGKMLEIGCGIGFFAEFMPPDLRDLVSLVGVEIDPTTYTIARLLHPRDQWHNRPVQQWFYKTGSLDGMVGNLPFHDGVYCIYESMLGKVNIAAWSICKACDLLKPGALLTVLSTTGVLDATGTQQEYVVLRNWLRKRMLFLGAVRLPARAFKPMSNTDVCMDLLIFQKRYSEDDRRQSSEPWLLTVPHPTVVSVKTGQPVRMNEYWLKNPEYLIGRPCLDKLTGDKLAVEYDSGDWIDQLQYVLDDLVGMQRWAIGL